MEDMPDEVVVGFFSYLKLTDLEKTQYVSKKWYELSWKYRKSVTFNSYHPSHIQLIAKKSPLISKIVLHNFIQKMNDISAITLFQNLKQLSLTGICLTSFNDFPPNLENLELIQCRIKSLSFLQLKKLREFICLRSNLEFGNNLEYLKNLEYFYWDDSFDGKSVVHWPKLTNLDVNVANVETLEHLQVLTGLRKLKLNNPLGDMIEISPDFLDKCTNTLHSLHLECFDVRYLNLCKFINLVDLRLVMTNYDQCTFPYTLQYLWLCPQNDLELIYLLSCQDSLKSLKIEFDGNEMDTSSIVDKFSHLQHLTKLESLELYIAGLSDSIYEYLPPNLNKLTLSGEQFTDDLLEGLNGLPLRELEVFADQSDITDTGLMALSSLTSLEVLQLNTPSITSEGCKVFKTLQNLSEVSLFDCQIEQEELESLVPSSCSVKNGKENQSVLYCAM